MPKLYKVGTFTTKNHGEQTLYAFHCPGCGNSHGFHVPRWQWNGSLEEPTFTPSLLCNPQDAAGTPNRCHSFVKNGKIQYLPDSYHKLAGQTVDIPDWEE